MIRSKKKMIALLSILWIKYANSQTLEAHYNVKFTVNIPTDNKKPEILNLDYEGLLFQSQARFIYFQKPLYLEKYSLGYYKTINNNRFPLYPVFMDSIQRLLLVKIDSLNIRMKLDMDKSTKPGYIFYNFDLGADEWKFFNEVKEINGLKCQHAVMYAGYDSSKIDYDVWFCPEININFGPGGIRDLPGLVVEGMNYFTNETYTLTSYQINKPIPDSIFWPKEFANAKFTIIPPVRKATHKAKQATDKRIDIIKQ
jgi:GLPGLI family protein